MISRHCHLSTAQYPGGKALLSLSQNSCSLLRPRFFEISPAMSFQDFSQIKDDVTYSQPAPERRQPVNRALLGVWIFVAVLTLYITAAGVGPRYRELSQTSQAVWSTGVAEYVDQQLHPNEGEALSRFGLTLSDYAVYILGIELLLSLIYFAPAVLIVWRRSDEWLAIMISLALISLGLTQPAIDDALVAVQPLWGWPVEGIQAFGIMAAFALAFIFFPDGHFKPPWTKVAFLLALLINTAWLLFPQTPFNPIYGATWERTPIASALVNASMVAVGVFAQTQRYRFYATPLQRQQIKAAMFGFVTLFMAEVARGMSYALLIPEDGPGAFSLFVNMVRPPVYMLLALFLPLSFAVTILRYRLWNFDLILRRTALYSLLTAAAVVFYALVVMISTSLFYRIFHNDTVWFTAVVALLAVMLLLPAYRYGQRRLERFFNRGWIDYQESLADFSSEIRTVISEEEVATILIERTEQLTGCRCAALLLRQAGGAFAVCKQHHVAPDRIRAGDMIDRYRTKLARGEGVLPSQDPTFAFMAPLLSGQTNDQELIGVLALGPRRSEQPYRRAEQALIMGMAERAAAAIVIARLVETEKEAEQRRRSPLGQAEQLAETIPQMEDPQSAILALFERALSSTRHVQELGHLSAVLRGHGEPQLALLAEGCHALALSRTEPEALVAGLQCIDRYLAEFNLDSSTAVGDRRIMTLSLDALRASSIDEVAALLAAPSHTAHEHSAMFDEFIHRYDELQPVGLALDKYGRSHTLDDRLVYLADALTVCSNMLSRLQENALTPARLVMQLLVEQWSKLFISAMHAERNRSPVTLTLVTRRVISGRTAELVVNVNNESRHPVADLRVTLKSDGQAGDHERVVELGSLSPQQRERIHFPGVTAGPGVHAMTFQLVYLDGFERKRQESVSLSFEAFSSHAAYRPIPNPYVTGAPLSAENSTFFGRDNELAYLRRAVTNATANNAIVLTGEKRMGKTSLLNHLSSHLPDSVVPVYIDAQGIGYEPGIGNLLYDIAAIVARSLAMPAPQPTRFETRGADLFRHEFLPDARKKLGRRRLVLLIDEFEELEQRVTSGLLDRQVFAYLRHLVQQEPGMAWIFVGPNAIADLRPDHWWGLFSGALHRPIGRLDAITATALITEPVEGYLRYDDLAIDKMMRLTAGHPYFLQLLCHVLVWQANQEQRSFVSSEEVDVARQQMLELGETHLLAMWRELSMEEQQTLAAVATLLADGTRPTSAQVFACLDEHVTSTAIDETLFRLVQRNILDVKPYDGVHRFALDLQRAWIFQRKVS